MRKKALVFLKALIVVVAVYVLLIFWSLVPMLVWPFALMAGVIVVIGCIESRKKKSFNFSRYALTIINPCLALFLLAFYFFVFDFVTGFYWPAVTWGLPVLAGIIFLIIDTIYMNRHDRQKRGMRGFAFGTVAFVYTAVMIIFFSGALIGTPVNNPVAAAKTENDRVIELALKEVYSKGLGYGVISPESAAAFAGYHGYTSLRGLKVKDLNPSSSQDGVFTFRTSRGSFSLTQADLDILVGKFLEANMSPQALNIVSSAKDGYYIDYDHRYTPGIWYSLQVWRVVHPADEPYMEMSLPFYDENTGLVIFYTGDEDDGYVYILKYENGEIRGIIKYQF